MKIFLLALSWDEEYFCFGNLNRINWCKIEVGQLAKNNNNLEDIFLIGKNLNISL
jgi:hypothetical protein